MKHIDNQPVPEVYLKTEILEYLIIRYLQKCINWLKLENIDNERVS